MPNNYLLPGDTLPRETTFHAAGHLFATKVLTAPGPPTFWHTAGLIASDAGAEEAIAEVVTAVSIEVDIAVAHGMTVLDDIHRHMDYLQDRPTCGWCRTRTLAHPLTDDEGWVATASLILLQGHWWAVSTLAEFMQMGLYPTAEVRDHVLAEVRCSPYAWDQVLIPLENRPRMADGTDKPRARAGVGALEHSRGSRQRQQRSGLCRPTGEYQPVPRRDRGLAPTMTRGRACRMCASLGS